MENKNLTEKINNIPEEFLESIINDLEANNKKTR